MRRLDGVTVSAATTASTAVADTVAMRGLDMGGGFLSPLSDGPAVAGRMERTGPETAPGDGTAVVAGAWRACRPLRRALAGEVQGAGTAAATRTPLMRPRRAFRHPAGVFRRRASFRISAK